MQSHPLTPEPIPPSRQDFLLPSLRRIDARSVPILQIAIWILLQFAALALSVFRIPFWAQAPHASESLALSLLLSVQIGSSAMLFPWIMPSTAGSVAVIATVWPFLFFAGVLAASPIRSIIVAGGYLTVWMAALALMALPLSTTRLRLIATAILSLWTVGGPILLFVHLEYGHPGEMGFGRTLLLGPIIGAEHLLTSGQTLAWAVPWIALSAGATMAAPRGWRRASQKLEFSDLSLDSKHQIL